LQLSLSDEGRIKRNSVEEILESLRVSRPTGLVTILRLFLHQIRRHEYTYHARVEYGGKEGEKLSEKILEKLNQNSSKALDLTVIDNPKLIAGCKIRLGDDVYENSISDRLNKLQKTFL
jgi:F0F1-type ATP synthase delta subunit